MLGTFFTITNENVSTTIGFAKDMIADTSPLWILIVGVGLALVVFEVIINAIRGRH